MMFLKTLMMLAVAAAQQSYNQILFPAQNVVIQAGGGVQSITWTNLTQGNVRLVLYSGTNPLTPRQTVADSIANTGTFLWTPETWLPAGSDYVLSVEDLSGTAATQYSPFFTVQLCSTCSAAPLPTTLSAPTASVSPTQVGTLASTRSQAVFANAVVTDASTATSAASLSSAASSVVSTVSSGSSAAAVSLVSGSSGQASGMRTSAAAGGSSLRSSATPSGSSSGGAASTTSRSNAVRTGITAITVIVAAAIMIL
ncbi:hypothetical protein PYCC9005_000022 [Savitreella phatthalungensis]